MWGWRWDQLQRVYGVLFLSVVWEGWGVWSLCPPPGPHPHPEPSAHLWQLPWFSYSLISPDVSEPEAFFTSLLLATWAIPCLSCKIQLDPSASFYREPHLTPIPVVRESLLCTLKPLCQPLSQPHLRTAVVGASGAHSSDPAGPWTPSQRQRLELPLLWASLTLLHDDALGEQSINAEHMSRWIKEMGLPAETLRKRRISQVKSEWIDLL